MTLSVRMSGEPVDPERSATGSAVLTALAAPLARARAWAGPRLEALLLGGSHASGEGVWVEHEGRIVTVSDLDLYAVLPDAAACAQAEARQRAAQPGLREALLAEGLAAPLEVAFLTRDGLARIPARPGALELLRTGVVLAGEARVRELVPRWEPADIAPEEVTLLLENRAFELLLAWPAIGSPEPLERLCARHARLKVAADLAGVLALEQHEWPPGAAARIAFARAHALASLAEALPGAFVEAASLLDTLWDEALAWRAHGYAAPWPESDVPNAAHGRHEWQSTARAWSAVWWRHANGDADPFDPWTLATRTAARAPLRRRVRRALDPASRSGVTPPVGGRLRHLLAGTPQHRVNASAAVLVLAAALSPGTPALPAGALRALRDLGVAASGDWDAARREVVRAWDLWVLDGQRTAEGA